MAIAGDANTVVRPIITGKEPPGAINYPPHTKGTFMAKIKNPVDAVIGANILATHAYQILLARNSGKAFSLFASDHSDEALKEAVANQKALLDHVNDVVLWTKGKRTAFPVESHLHPILDAGLALDLSAPFCVVLDYLTAKSGKEGTPIDAVASLYQMCLEIHRDGDVLQQLYDLYIALGLPVDAAMLGLPAKMKDFEQAGHELAAKTAPCPFDTDMPAWRICGAKVLCWGQKKTHIRDEKVLAAEILRESDLQATLPKLRALPPMRVAIVGHSFTMAVNWSSPSSFTAIAGAAFEKVNPKVEFKHWGEGGMRALRAQEAFVPQAKAWKPNVLFLFTGTPEPKDLDALVAMDKDLRQAGIRVFIFPHNGPLPYYNVPQIQAFAKANNLSLADFTAVVDSAPNKAEFLSLDGIHMTEPWHRLMAKELLKFLASQG